ncbi:MAG: MarR family winged helix-turn-helix transcriptional regulator [Pseudomonadota bacterium]
MTTETLLDLSRFLPFRLSVLSNTVSERIAATYRRDFGLSTAQWRVIAVIRQAPGLTATALTEQTAMDKVAVSRAVAGLIGDKRLERRATPHDGRSSALFLTRAGELIYDQVAPLAQELEENLLRTLSEKERADLERLMIKLARAASPDRQLW